MFEKLVVPNQTQLEAAAVELQKTAPVLFKVDPKKIYVLVKPCANHEVDFFLVERSGDTWIPVPVLGSQLKKLNEWASVTIPKLCATWKKLFPHSTIADA